jgi:hypothetical protein
VDNEEHRHQILPHCLVVSLPNVPSQSADYAAV